MKSILLGLIALSPPLLLAACESTRPKPSENSRRGRLQFHAPGTGSWMDTNPVSPGLNEPR